MLCRYDAWSRIHITYSNFTPLKVFFFVRDIDIDVLISNTNIYSHNFLYINLSLINYSIIIYYSVTS